MVAGSWPGAPPRPPDVRGGSARAPATVRAAVPQRAAQRLGLHVGDTLRVTSRLHGPPDVRVEITGIYTPVSPGSATWRSLDPLHGEGVAVGDFTSYGPLAVPGSAFASGPAPHRAGGPLWPPRPAGRPTPTSPPSTAPASATCAAGWRTPSKPSAPRPGRRTPSPGRTCPGCWPRWSAPCS
ncbi:hypothetical protein ACWV95_13635 [Streptomyces albus]